MWEWDGVNEKLAIFLTHPFYSTCMFVKISWLYWRFYKLSCETTNINIHIKISTKWFWKLTTHYITWRLSVAFYMYWIILSSLHNLSCAMQLDCVTCFPYNKLNFKTDTCRYTSTWRQSSCYLIWIYFLAIYINRSC